jgi:hypothetical protein
MFLTSISISATVSSATPSAFRPGTRSTGMPFAVAESMSMFVGLPRHEQITFSVVSFSICIFFRLSASVMNTSTPSSAATSPLPPSSCFVSAMGAYLTSPYFSSAFTPSSVREAVIKIFIMKLLY